MNTKFCPQLLFQSGTLFSPQKRKKKRMNVESLVGDEPGKDM